MEDLEKAVKQSRYDTGADFAIAHGNISDTLRRAQFAQIQSQQHTASVTNPGTAANNNNPFQKIVQITINTTNSLDLPDQIPAYARSSVAEALKHTTQQLNALNFEYITPSRPSGAPQNTFSRMDRPHPRHKPN